MVRVIGAGFGRTGTHTLKTALEALGFGPAYHMYEVFQHPEHATIWQAAARGEAVNWDEVLGAYDSTTDWPAAAFYDQHLARWPDARVILTIRDPESWYRSCRNTIAHGIETWEIPPDEDQVPEMIREVIWEGTFDGRFADRDHALTVYNRHNDEVRAHVPDHQLLVYEVRQGWEPLCRFLGVPVPDAPFPHTNSSEEWAQRREEEAARSDTQA